MLSNFTKVHHHINIYIIKLQVKNISIKIKILSKVHHVLVFFFFFFLQLFTTFTIILFLSDLMILKDLTKLPY
jgi:hypothetical protein